MVYRREHGGAVKNGPDANNKPSPAGAGNGAGSEHDTRPLNFASDRYERDTTPQPARVGHSPLPPAQSVVNAKYRIDVELGRGGMGAVYRAHHVELRKPVALKWLLPEFASDPESRQRFAREARAASNIKHENVVDVYDFGIDAERGIPYIVMELLTGFSLKAYLDQHGRLEAREALEIMIQCMRGVAAAHKLGIVHRDLKPENIFLCEGDDPGTFRVKVLDFGVAAALDPPTEDGVHPIITRTTSRNIVGTVFYMPPEQLAGGAVDERADVYAIGVILYELLVGKPPYRGQTLNAVTTAILDGNAVPLTAAVPDLDPEYAKLVHRAMAVRNAERFVSSSEMIRAFQQYRTGARRGPALQETQPSLDRAHTRVWAVATIVGLLLGGLIAWAVVALRTPNADRPPETALPQLRPQPETPSPVLQPEPEPEFESSRSAATSPEVPPPAPPTAAAVESPRAEEPARSPRVRKQPARPARPPVEAASKPAPEPSPATTEEKPAPKTPAKPPPRIRYAEPW